MFAQAGSFLVDVVFGLFTYAFLLRFYMQLMRAPYRNPLGQATVAVTDWAVKPVRRALPGFRGVDWATLLLAYLAQFLWLLMLGFVVAPMLRGGSAIVVILALAAVELLKASLWILIVSVFVQAVLSWIAPDGPLSGVLNALTFRFLAPLRRLIPPIGGALDLSPLIVLVLANLALRIPVRWLEAAVLGLGAS